MQPMRSLMGAYILYFGFGEGEGGIILVFLFVNYVFP
jgi:hypothetical protein